MNNFLLKFSFAVNFLLLLYVFYHDNLMIIFSSDASSKEHKPILAHDSLQESKLSNNMDLFMQYEQPSSLNTDDLMNVDSFNETYSLIVNMSSLSNKDNLEKINSLNGPNPSIAYKPSIFLSLDELKRINLLEETESPNHEKFNINEFKYPTNQTIYFDLRDFDISNVGGGTVSELESLMATKGRKLTLDIICNAEGRYGGFQHSSQLLFRCWSLLERFSSDITWNKHMYLPSKFFDTYTTQMMNFFGEHFNLTMLRSKNSLDLFMKRNTTWLAKQSRFDNPNCAWHSVSTYAQPPLVACKWFMKEEDTRSFQRAVLGGSYQSGCVNTTKLQILVVDRKGDTRDWKNYDEFNELMKLLNLASFDLRYMSNFKYFSLYEQAREMHAADIIISMHGAQLTNLAYIKKCTAVIEMFPKSYYLYYYQLLTNIAGGMHFEGYIDGSNRWKDTNEGSKIPSSKRRGKPILASPVSLISSLPLITSAILECRSKCHDL